MLCQAVSSYRVLFGIIYINDNSLGHSQYRLIQIIVSAIAAHPVFLHIHPFFHRELWLDSVELLLQGNGCCSIVSVYHRS